MKNNKKALAVLTIGLCMGASLCACGVSANFSKTETTTTTDSNGNTTTVTTTTENGSDPVTTVSETSADDDSYGEGSCAAMAEDGAEHKVSVSIENETGEDITGLYMCTTGETSWSNLFDEGETLADGETVDDYIDLTYSEDSMSFDSGIDLDGNDDTIEFAALDISDVSADGFTLTFVKTADGYGWHIDASYVR